MSINDSPAVRTLCSCINTNFDLYYEKQFSQRIISEWNKLNNNVRDCSSVLNSEVKMDKYLKEWGFI